MLAMPSRTLRSRTASAPAPGTENRRRKDDTDRTSSAPGAAVSARRRRGPLAYKALFGRCVSKMGGPKRPGVARDPLRQLEQRRASSPEMRPHPPHRIEPGSNTPHERQNERPSLQPPRAAEQSGPQQLRGAPLLCTVAAAAGTPGVVSSSKGSNWPSE